MGRITIFRISIIIEKKLTGTYSPPSHCIRNGVIKGAINVATAVSVTESATFALAMYDITFDASPLGQQPTKIIPAAISLGKLKILASGTSAGEKISYAGRELIVEELSSESFEGIEVAFFSVPADVTR